MGLAAQKYLNKTACLLSIVDPDHKLERRLLDRNMSVSVFNSQLIVLLEDVLLREVVYVEKTHS